MTNQDARWHSSGQFRWPISVQPEHVGGREQFPGPLKMQQINYYYFTSINLTAFLLLLFLVQLVQLLAGIGLGGGRFRLTNVDFLLKLFLMFFQFGDLLAGLSLGTEQFLEFILSD